MHDKELSRAVQNRMTSLGVFKTELANEIGKTRRTVWLWLAREMTQQRHDALMMALDRIEGRKGVN